MKTKRKYSEAELDQAALADLINDAVFAEKQAEEGPFYPPKITRESLLAYARECREAADRHANGGAHNFALYGEPLVCGPTA